MYIITRNNLFAIVLTALCLFSSALALADTPYEERVTHRRDSDRLIGGSIKYYVHVVSNMPEDEIMQPVCGIGMSRKDRCRYRPLASIGTYGKKKDEVLPTKDQKLMGERWSLVVVIDRSTLTADDKERLAKLLAAFFPTVTLANDPKTVKAWILNLRKEGAEYNVLFDLPKKRSLEQLMTDMQALPDEEFPKNKQKVFTFTRFATRTAMLSNDEPSKNILVNALPYSEITQYGLEEAEQFSRVEGVDYRIIALNWNGPRECSWETAQFILPDTLLAEIAAEKSTRTGLTSWQRFCHTAVAKACKEDDAITWVIGAPTEKYLRQLAPRVAEDIMPNTPRLKEYSLRLTDLSLLKSIALGVYVQQEDPDRKKLVVQHELEEDAAKLLGGKIKLVTVENWGDILQKAINANSDDPFKDPAAIRMVNQASKADAVILLWVRDLRPQVSYDFPKRRLTKNFPPFTLAEPVIPLKPDPDEILYGAVYKYAEREKDKRYLKDLAKYQDELLPRYRRDHRDWEDERDKWEQNRRNYQVNYVFEIFAHPTMRMNGYLKLIDAVSAQKVMWSYNLSNSRQGESKLLRTIPVTVRGEDTDPAVPYEISDSDRYGEKTLWGDCVNAIGGDRLYGIGSQCLFSGIREGLGALDQTALWPGDVKAWNLPDKSFVPDPPIETPVIDPPVPDPPVVNPPLAEPEKIDGLLVNGKVMMPLNALVEAWLGAKCYLLDKNTSTYHIVKNRASVVIKAGQTNATINGEESTFVNPPFQMIDNTGYVSVDFIADSFGMEYTKKSKSVYILVHPDDAEKKLMVTGK